MNNISQFPTQVHYPTLDIDMLHQASAGAGKSGIEVKQLFIQTDYLPSLHARVSEVDSVVRRADFELRETVHSLDTALKINVNVLREFQAELDDASDSDREEIVEDIAKRVSDIGHIVSGKQLVLNRLFSAMTPSVDRTVTGTYIEQLEADELRLPAEVQAIKERQEKLEEKRKALTEAMALIEAKGFSELAKETALTTQELVKLGMAPPEMAAIQGAIELAQQVLERTETLINYLGLMEARNTVRKQINNLIASAYEKTNELRMVSLRKNFIIACHEFDDNRARYTTEFEKFIIAKRAFLSTYLTVDAHDQNVVSQFAVDALSLAKHLKAIG